MGSHPCSVITVVTRFGSLAKYTSMVYSRNLESLPVLDSDVDSYDSSLSDSDLSPSGPIDEKLTSRSICSNTPNKTRLSNSSPYSCSLSSAKISSSFCLSNESYLASMSSSSPNSGENTRMNKSIQPKSCFVRKGELKNTSDVDSDSDDFKRTRRRKRFSEKNSISSSSENECYDSNRENYRPNRCTSKVLKDFFCEHCHLKFRRYSALKSHLVTCSMRPKRGNETNHSSPSVSSQSSVESADNLLSTRRKFRIRHNNQSAKTKTAFRKCPICSQQLNHGANFLNHMREHENLASSQLESRKRPVERMKREVEWDVLPGIDMDASSRNRMLEKLRLSPSKVITTDTLHVCSYCCKSFHRKAALDSHVKSHEVDQGEEEDCSKQTCNFLLAHNIDQESEQKVFLCDICGSCLIRKTAFIGHMQSHGAARAFNHDLTWLEKHIMKVKELYKHEQTNLKRLSNKHDHVSKTNSANDTLKIENSECPESDLH